MVKDTFEKFELPVPVPKPEPKKRGGKHGVKDPSEINPGEQGATRKKYNFTKRGKSGACPKICETFIYTNSVFSGDLFSAAVNRKFRGRLLRNFQSVYQIFVFTDF